MINNHTNTQEDDDFIREFPIPDSDLDDIEHLKLEEDDKRYCCDCDYYNNNFIFPCAVNPKKIHRADECSDYELKK